MVDIGTVVGSFRLTRKLGGGGMGTVYLGEHTRIGSKVAVKFLHEHLASSESLVQRFMAEARAVNLIGHENIINIFDMNVLPPGRYYLVMEYLEGQPLGALLRRPVAPAVVVPILTQVCDALQAAHSHGVVHRDLKPENIFLVRHDRTPHFVKLLDFGIAKLLDPGQAPAQTSLGTLLGTPEYMAPEQWTDQHVDGRTDLYALGIIAYWMLTGHRPFHGEGLGELLQAHLQQVPPSPRDVNPEVPEALASVVIRAMAKRAENRFQSAAELRAALEQALDVRASVPASPRGGVTPAVAPPSRTLEPHASDISAWVALSPGAEPLCLPCTELTRAGAVLCTEGPLPPLRSRVALTLKLRDRSLPCTAEVVRHIPPALAAAWGIHAGFAVEFIGLSATAREALASLRQAHAPTPVTPPQSLPDDPQAERLLAQLLKRMISDPYALLSLPRDATFERVHQHVRDARRGVEALAARPLSARQARELAQLRLRVEKAASLLGNPHQRIEHDAWHGNYLGVARCISGGLSSSELESLHARYLVTHPGAEVRERIHANAAAAWEARGELARALAEYEEALAADPLELQLLQRYLSLKRESPGWKPEVPEDGAPVDFPA
jgi:serine/threonine-protein kinase